MQNYGKEIQISKYGRSWQKKKKKKTKLKIIYIASALGLILILSSSAMLSWEIRIGESLVRPVVWKLILSYRCWKEYYYSRPGRIDGRNFECQLCRVWAQPLEVWWIAECPQRKALLSTKLWLSHCFICFKLICFEFCLDCTYVCTYMACMAWGGTRASRIKRMNGFRYILWKLKTRF